MTRAGPRALLAVLVLIAGAARAEATFPLEGAWHVLVHYRDATAHDPEQWRWEDRVWVLRVEGSELVWTEYLLVQFADNQGRFTNLGTNMAARVPGAWEPGFRQRHEIETGLRVVERSVRSQRLERVGRAGEPTGWQSPAGARALARLARGSVYVSNWRVYGGPGLPVFEQVDELISPDGVEPVGAARYTARHRDDDGVVTGDYDRDGKRRGRFRMTPTRLVLRSRAPPLAGGGRVRLGRGEGMKPSPRMLWSWLVPLHYYGRREIEIDTRPPGAVLDLAYLRRGTQLDFARARAPVVVELPSRASTTPQDVLRVRARADGYERDSYIVEVDSRQDELRIELEPLANELERVTHRTLAGRSALSLETRLEPVIHARRTREELTLVLADTSLAPGVDEELARVHGPHIAAGRARQAGSDLIVRLRLSEPAREGGVEVRTWSGIDPVRERHVTVLDWLLPEDGPARVARLQAALAALGPDAIDACALELDARLRETVLPEVRRRAFAASPGFATPVVRASLRRLAELSPDGRLRLDDGAQLDPARPLELDLAVDRAESVVGLLALLRALVAGLEPEAWRQQALRGLVAPDLAADRFDAAWAGALEAERACRSMVRRVPGA